MCMARLPPCRCSHVVKCSHQPSGQEAVASAKQRQRKKSKGCWQFKHFTVEQDQCAQPVGTDSMLLGSWADPGPATSHILDIGCGTGVLGLMLAQKAGPHAIVHAIDVDPAACEQAAVNAAASPWAGRIHVFHASLEQLVAQQQADAHLGPNSPDGAPLRHRRQINPGPMPLSSWYRPPGGGYECIICNPPFFINSYLPTAQHTSDSDDTPEREAAPATAIASELDASAQQELPKHHLEKRAVARHVGAGGVGLTYDALAAGAAALLVDHGALYVVLPMLNREALVFDELAAQAGLQLAEVLEVYPLPPPKPVKRRLMKFVKNAPGKGHQVLTQTLVMNLGVEDKIALGLDPGLTVPTQEYLQFTKNYHHEAFQSKWGEIYRASSMST